MSEIIRIPTKAELSTRLEGVGRLVTAREWERAAIVAAYVETHPRGSKRMSVSDFAKLGIVGLSSPGTVHFYLNRWLDSHNHIHPEPGAEVELPEAPWEPRAVPSPISDKLDADEAVRALVQRHGSEVMASVVERQGLDFGHRHGMVATIEARDYEESRRDKLSRRLRGLQMYLNLFQREIDRGGLSEEEMLIISQARSNCGDFADGRWTVPAQSLLDDDLLNDEDDEDDEL